MWFVPSIWWHLLFGIFKKISSNQFFFVIVFVYIFCGMTQPKTKSSPNLGPWKTIIMGPLPNDQLVENVTILVFEQFISIWEMKHVQNSLKVKYLLVKMAIILQNTLLKLRYWVTDFKINKSPSFLLSLKVWNQLEIFKQFCGFWCIYQLPLSSFCP